VSVQRRLYSQINPNGRDGTARYRVPVQLLLLKEDAAYAAELKNMTPDEFRKLIHDEVVKWTSVATTADIRVQ